MYLPPRGGGGLLDPKLGIDCETMFRTISTALPPSGEKQFRKISQKLERWLYICQFWKW